ncbi:DUF3841 domain-containing protein [Herbaspirillum rhizosphaerae]|uniref:DUF3841 domain-containing protein n=1 Tax=Herbaspirillum rhizosphaerae TaxID=346179 RepID=UPI00067B3BE0|nr:DUF3841 domain-containing protein [Herbaspirillum rhizosphaerae]
MKLLTFQLAQREAALTSGERYVVPWTCVEQAWLPAYRWLVAVWEGRSGEAVNSAPVWCWQRLAGDVSVADCALELFSEADRQAGILMLELDVPPSMVLLSSYSAWNDLLYGLIGNGDVPAGEACRSMFDVGHLDDGNDAVQAIIPFIEPAWIISMVRMNLPAAT